MLPTDHDGSFHVLEYHQRYRNEELIKYMPYQPGLHVLACGRGVDVLLDQLVGRTAATWGLDRALPRDVAPLPCAQVAVAAPEAAPFAARAFDVVIAEQALSTAAAPGRTVHEWGRVLRPGGWLILWERRRWIEAREPSMRRWLRAGGLIVREREHYDYLAHPAALAMSQLPGLAYSDLAQALSKAVFALDGLLGRWAPTHHRSWDLILVASKGEGSDGSGADARSVDRAARL
ncbi:MAG: methyltransferase domain-containing protein [Anaerolineae bacterium]|nr:methyltransferase domain-containing protein [Anaerolineae bacterium]